MKTIFVTIALSALLALRRRVAGASDAYSGAVRSGDLNLATFHGRVKTAANQVCGTVPVLSFQRGKRPSAAASSSSDPPNGT
jgi:UrcA family protein